MAEPPLYPMPPGQGPGPGPGQGPGLAPEARRPASVTAAAVIMMVGALFGLINGIATLAAASTVAEDFRRRGVATGAPPQTVRDLSDGVRAGLLANGAAAVVLAAIIGLLAIWVLRGSNVARILTWIVLAAGCCCGGCGAGATFGTLREGNVDLKVENVSDATARALGQALQDSLPSWLTLSTGGLGCLQVLLYLVVAGLLALPASNAYFRRPALAWQPPEAGWPTAP